MIKRKDIGLIIVVVLFLIITLVIATRMNRKSEPFEYKSNLSSSEKIMRWISWITPHAKRIGREYGIPWQAIAAQTGWETGWGKSSLINEAWNFGGQKAAKGEPYVIKRTHEYYDGKKVWVDAKFRKWDSLDEGLAGYANFFHKYSRYHKALQYPNDPYRFIEEIRKAGYATSPNYITNLHGILDNYIVGKNIPEYSFTGASPKQILLKRGSRGEHVEKLQKYLNTVATLNLIDTIEVDGIFGPKTEELLSKIFQVKQIDYLKLKEQLNENKSTCGKFI